MKYLLPIFCLILIVGCKNTQTIAEAETPIPPITPLDSIEIVETVIEELGDSLVVSFEKTACFGRCPSYKIKVYKSGFSTYEGLNFTERMGLYSGQFTESEMEEIYQKALDINYFELESVYDNPLISDLPSTISKIQMEGKSHKIKARIEVPDDLKKFHDELSIMLMRRSWDSYNAY